MKNLIIYTSSNKKFDKEHSILSKIQVDNSIELGWNNKDILIVTNFPFIYKNITSITIPNGIYYDFDNSSNKIPVIIYLYKNGYLNNQDLYWYHDFDAYQLVPFNQHTLCLGSYDIGITPYGYKPQWNLGSIFFKVTAYDIFELIDEEIKFKRKHNERCDEYALKRLIDNDKINNNRYKNLNVTYNLTKRCIQTNYRKAQKPIKVVHFHPWDKDNMMNDTALNIFMYGKNRLNKPLLNERIIKIFIQNGIY